MIENEKMVLACYKLGSMSTCGNDEMQASLSAMYALGAEHRYGEDVPEWNDVSQKQHDRIYRLLGDESQEAIDMLKGKEEDA